MCLLVFFNHVVEIIHVVVVVSRAKALGRSCMHDHAVHTRVSCTCVMLNHIRTTRRARRCRCFVLAPATTLALPHTPLPLNLPQEMARKTLFKRKSGRKKAQKFWREESFAGGRQHKHCQAQRRGKNMQAREARAAKKKTYPCDVMGGSR